MSVKDCDLKVIQDTVRAAMARTLSAEYEEIKNAESEGYVRRSAVFEKVKAEVAESLKKFQDEVDRAAERNGLVLRRDGGRKPVVMFADVSARYSLESQEKATRRMRTYAKAMECESLKAALWAKEDRSVFDEAVAKAVSNVRKGLENACKD